MPSKGKTTKSDAKTQSSKNMETKNECVQGSDGEAALGTSVQDLGDTLDSWQRRQTDICTNRKALSPHTVDPRCPNSRPLKARLDQAMRLVRAVFEE